MSDEELTIETPVPSPLQDSEDGMSEARRSMYLCWIIALVGVLGFMAWTQFIWPLLLAMMVVHVMVR